MHESAHVSRITPRYTTVLLRPAHFIPIFPFPVVDWVDSAFLFDCIELQAKISGVYGVGYLNGYVPAWDNGGVG